jgi:hypothetical protein
MRAASEERNWSKSLRRYGVREQTLLGHARGRARKDEDGQNGRRWVSCPMVAACSGDGGSGEQAVFQCQTSLPSTYNISDMRITLLDMTHSPHQTLRSPISLASLCLMQDIRWQGYHLALTATQTFRSAQLNWRWAAHLLFLRASHRFVGAS